MGGAIAALVVVIIAYIILSKRMQTSEYRRIQKLQQGTKEKTFSDEILFQKLYLTYIKKITGGDFLWKIKPLVC